MLKKIKELKCEDVNTLVTILNVDMEQVLSGQFDASKIDYSKLLYIDMFSIVCLPENKNNLYNVENEIEDIMLKCFDKYLKLKKEYYNDFLKNFVNLYEKLILNSKFEDITLRSFQRQIMINKIQDYIKSEDYEICSEIKEKINEI
jgi:hypothetical protein